MIAGGSGADFHGDFHDRNVHENIGIGIHHAQRKLHEKHVEHHGLHCRSFRVRLMSFQEVISIRNQSCFENFKVGRSNAQRLSRYFGTWQKVNFKCEKELYLKMKEHRIMKNE